MEIGDREWLTMLREGAASLDVEITPEQAECFAEFARLLLLWNRRFNLTAITEPEEVAIKHFIDSLAPLPLITEEARVLDIGAGGGFPSIPLKIARPSLRLTLIDSVRKKVTFQQQAILGLNLSNAEARHIRAEDYPKQIGGRFDVVICRALGALAAFARLALPMTAEGGRIIALKGRLKPEETDELREKLPALSVDIRRYNLPFSGDHRTLAILSPTG